MLLLSWRLRRVALVVVALGLLQGERRVWAGDPPAAPKADPAVAEFIEKAEKELHRLDRVTLRWLSVSAPEATRSVEHLSSYALDRAVPTARRTLLGAGDSGKKLELPTDLGNREWWKSAQSTLDEARAGRSQTDRTTWGPSYDVFDGRAYAHYGENAPPRSGWWAIVKASSGFTGFPEGLMPAYYLRTGETIAANLRRFGESRLVRTGFGKTAIVSIGRTEKEYGQWLILRGDGSPVVEEYSDAKGLSLDTLSDRLRKAATIEETRAWPEVLMNHRVLGWIESKDFPPVPETNVMRSKAVMGPNAGRSVLGAIRTTYVGPLDPSTKFEGVPKELEGQTIEVMDVMKRTVERRYPDGRIEPIDNVVDWDAESRK